MLPEGLWQGLEAFDEGPATILLQLGHWLFQCPSFLHFGHGELGGGGGREKVEEGLFVLPAGEEEGFEKIPLPCDELIFR